MTSDRDPIAVYTTRVRALLDGWARADERVVRREDGVRVHAAVARLADALQAGLSPRRTAGAGGLSCGRSTRRPRPKG
jgi:hypothetical protein